MRLEINGIEADVRQIMAITRQVADINDMTTRSVDVTNQFSLPKTNVNQQIFESGDEIHTTGNKIDKLFNAKIIDQFFLFNGFGKVKEVNGNYKFQLIDSSKNLFNNMNKKINQLNFESDDFTFNITSYNNLKLLSTSVWVWSIISMHENKTSTQTPIPATVDADLKYLRPSFRVKTILDKIFDDNNWTLSYDNTLIDQLEISSNTSNFYVTSYQKTLDVTYNPAGSPVNITGLNTNDFENVVSTTSTVIDIGSIKTSFRLRGTIITNATIKVIFTGTTSVGGDVTTEELTIYSGTNIIDYTTGFFDTTDAGHDIEITVDGTGSIEFDDTLLYTIIEEADLGNFQNNNLIGYRVKAYDNLPDLNQIDIFKLGLIMTNSLIDSNTFNKTIDLKSMIYSKLYNYDWSDKYVIGSINIQNELPSYAQTNYFEYDNDETVNPNLGRSSFTIDSEILEDEITFIKLIFGASNEVDISSNTIAHFDIYTNTIKVDNDLNIRLVYGYNDAGDAYTLARFLQVNWETIKTTYYDDFVNSIYKPRYCEALFNLNKLDVLGFDFMRVIYVDKLKSSFMVYGIEDFVPNELTKVKMLKFR
jgi:hypothetical protein